MPAEISAAQQTERTQSGPAIIDLSASPSAPPIHELPSGNVGPTAILTANLPEALRPQLLPAVKNLVHRVQPQGLWLYGSWARGTASRRSDVDLLVMGLQDRRLLEAYEVVLQALAGCPLPLQPLVASPQLLARHGDAPFWRSVRADAIPLLAGSCFP